MMNRSAACFRYLVPTATKLRFVVLFLCMWLLQPQSFATELATLRGNTMGTTYTVKINTNDSKINTGELKSKIDTRLQEINSQMSTYINDSEVSRFNRSSAGEWFSVSHDTATVVNLAQTISRQTGGAFDVTVSPLVRLWGFGAGSDVSAGFIPPGDDEIRNIQELIGFSKLEVRVDPPELRKSVDGLEIDLSAIAKGFAVDEVCDVLIKYNLNDFMVEIGGEVRVTGERKEDQPWSVGIELPTKDQRMLNSIIRPANTAIASSGDYRNFHEYQGVVYSHTIDPQTGQPVSHTLASVTVLKSDCATADALATALLVMGPVKGKQWAEENQIAAVFITRSKDGFTQAETNHFDIPIEKVGETKPKNEFAKVLIVAIVVFGIALLFMSVGVIFSNRRIKGSCGGLAGLKDEKGKTLCEACTNPSPDCGGENLKHQGQHVTQSEHLPTPPAN